MIESVPEITPNYKVRVHEIDMEEYKAGALSPDVQPDQVYVEVVQRVRVHPFGQRPRIIEQTVWMSADDWFNVTREAKVQLQAMSKKLAKDKAKLVKELGELGK